MSLMLYLLMPLIFQANPRLSGEPLPSFPGTDVIEVGRTVRTLGQEFRFGFATVKGSDVAVAKYFMDTWINQGLPTVIERTPDKRLVVAAFDVIHGIQRTVIVAREETETVIFSAIADLWPNLPSPKVRTLSNETELSLNQINWLDDETESRQVESYVEESIEKAKEGVMRNLEDKGYAQVREQRGSIQVLLEHRKGSKSAVTLLRPIDGSLTAVSQILVEHRHD
jgi:hypothetical protein